MQQTYSSKDFLLPEGMQEDDLVNLTNNLNDEEYIELESRVKIFEEVIISRVKLLQK